jgi:hypothetical protein
LLATLQQLEKHSSVSDANRALGGPSKDARRGFFIHQVLAATVYQQCGFMAPLRQQSGQRVKLD